MRTKLKAGHTLLLVAAIAAVRAGPLHAADNPGKAASQCRAVQANAPWQGTGISVGPGQFVCVAADGLWSHGAQGIQGITPFYGPEGFGKDDPDNVPEVVSRVGALIGKIGTGAPFLIERQLCFVPTGTGELLLSMNDDPGTFDNNAGALRVQIVKWASARWIPDRISLNPQSCRSK